MDQQIILSLATQHNMTKEQIEKRIKELEDQLKIVEINYHRVSGAIAFLKELITKGEVDGQADVH